MESFIFFKIISHLIEDIIDKRNYSFLIRQNKQIIRNNYKKNEKIIRDSRE